MTNVNPTGTINKMTDDLDLLIPVFPENVKKYLSKHPKINELREIVLDLGRHPEFRFAGKVVEQMLQESVTPEEIKEVEIAVGNFNTDNRAGIERTLHRISAIRNRRGKIVGLTFRVGRAVYGTVDIIKDIIKDGKNLLILGPPGMGKTTKLREIARMLADEEKKRVIIVDTSNEIGGDGDIPHPGIGHSRRMQVSSPDKQHAVMIEAVENHMPEVIIVDEIGTEPEALAARTIAERGVQLVGTAHGTRLENLLKNPTLSDLVGGVQAVILGDEEAKKRHSQKTVLERKAPPTFDVVVELQDLYTLAVYFDVAQAIDQLLKGLTLKPEIRRQEPGQPLKILQESSQDLFAEKAENLDSLKTKKEGYLYIFAFGVSTEYIDRAVKTIDAQVELTGDLAEADCVLTLKRFMKRNSKLFKILKGRSLPIHVIKENNVNQIIRFLNQAMNQPIEGDDSDVAMREMVDIIEQVNQIKKPIDASPQPAYIRRLQHQFLEEKGYHSESIGEEPRRRVRVYPH